MFRRDPSLRLFRQSFPLPSLLALVRASLSLCKSIGSVVERDMGSVTAWQHMTVSVDTNTECNELRLPELRTSSRPQTIANKSHSQSTYSHVDSALVRHTGGGSCSLFWNMPPPALPPKNCWKN